MFQAAELLHLRVLGCRQLVVGRLRHSVPAFHLGVAGRAWLCKAITCCDTWLSMVCCCCPACSSMLWYLRSIVSMKDVNLVPPVHRLHEGREDIHARLFHG